MKSKGEKERYPHLNAEFQRIARRDKKAFLSDQCKEIEEKTEWERLEISSRKLEIPREHFGRKVMTNLDSILKSRDITLPTKVYLVKAMSFL